MTGSYISKQFNNSKVLEKPWGWGKATADWGRPSASTAQMMAKDNSASTTSKPLHVDLTSSESDADFMMQLERLPHAYWDSLRNNPHNNCHMSSSNEVDEKP